MALAATALPTEARTVKPASILPSGKVERQLLLLFVACVLIPIGALSVVCFEYVTDKIFEQSQERLQHASKTTGVAVYERLLALEGELEAIGRELATSGAGSAPRLPAELTDQLGERFRAVGLVTDTGAYVPLYGPILRPPNRSPGQRRHLASGKTLVVARSPTNRTGGVLLSRTVSVEGGRSATLLAEASIGHLLGSADEAPPLPGAAFCLLNENGERIGCSHESASSLPARAALELSLATSGQFKWTRDGEEQLASYWPIFLQPTFFTPRWTVVVSRAKGEFLAPIASFRSTFPLLVLLSLCAISLVIIGQLRRRLAPLVRLQHGTRQIVGAELAPEKAAGNGDEFEELAASINLMASRLSNQLKSMKKMIEIDRLILAATDTTSVVSTLCEHIRELYPCDVVAVTLMTPYVSNELETLFADESGEPQMVIGATGLSAEEIERFCNDREHIRFDLDESVPHFLEPLANAGVRRCGVLPLFLQEELAGFVALGHRDPQKYSELGLVYPRQLVDQSSIALANAQILEENRALAYYDSLTGLPNRRMYKERLAHTLQYAQHHGRLVATCFLDLDGFKRVNDTFGHVGGDQLLVEVAKRLIGCVRLRDSVARADAAEPDAALSRLGGDEFTFLLSEIADAHDAAKVAARILESLAKPFFVNRQEVFVSASIGIAVFPFDGEDAETLLRNADTAMYHAKGRGRNNYQFYAKSMNAAAGRKLHIESRLRRALDREDFVLHYQPLREAVSGRLVGAEALLRWHDAEMGPVSPAEFIPIAEDTSLIVPIGEWVLHAACAQSREWQSAGFRPIRISVNVSGHQIRQPSLVETVERVLRDTELSPDSLELEITESTIMQDDNVTLTTLQKLSEMGILLTLDDFGTGYSSLSYLRRFPLDRLKIDRSFVGGIQTNPDDAALTGAIIAMAHGLRLQVVAEGVETTEQAEFLRANGCDELQGYLLSPPVPPQEFARFLDTQKPD